MNSLGQNGGFGNLLSISFGEMIEEGTGEPSVYSTIFSKIAGEDILASFLRKDFTYLDRKKSTIREGILKAIALTGSREDLVEKIINDVCKNVIPASQVKEREICEAKVKRVSRLTV